MARRLRLFLTKNSNVSHGALHKRALCNYSNFEIYQEFPVFWNRKIDVLKFRTYVFSISNFQSLKATSHLKMPKNCFFLLFDFIEVKHFTNVSKKTFENLLKGPSCSEERFFKSKFIKREAFHSTSEIPDILNR